MNHVENWYPLYQDLAQLIGQEATRKLQQFLGGSQLSFPKRLLDPTREASLIYQAHQRGQSVTQLAREHDYSERNIRRILARYKA